MNCALTFVPARKINSEPGGIITLHIGDNTSYEYRRHSIPEYKMLILFFDYVNKMPEARIDLRINR